MIETIILLERLVYDVANRRIETRKSYRVRVGLGGVRTLRTQDTSDPRQFGTSAEVSDGHFGPFIKC